MVSFFLHSFFFHQLLIFEKLVCGSGLGDIAEMVENKIIVPYSEIPEFPRSTVHGHKGNLVFGILSDLHVVCMQGRFHPYEGKLKMNFQNKCQNNK